jgi:hypothetical protein
VVINNKFENLRKVVMYGYGFADVDHGTAAFLEH